METLKIILDGCQWLERIKVRWGKRYSCEGDLLKIITESSPEGLHELKINWKFSCSRTEIFLEDLEPTFLKYLDKYLHRRSSIIWIICDLWQSLVGFYFLS